MKCGECGEYFDSKVQHSNSKYKWTVWWCNSKFKKGGRCVIPHLYQPRIKELFLETLGILMEDRETVIVDGSAVMDALTDCGSINGETEEASGEMEVVAGIIQRLVDENIPSET